MSSGDIASQHIQRLLEAYFKVKVDGEKGKESIFCEGGIEKSVPLDHRLSSISKPRYAKWSSSVQIFLSHPHTYDGFLYCVDI